MGRDLFRSISRRRGISLLSPATFVLSLSFVVGCGGASPSGVVAGPVVSSPALTAVRILLSPDTLVVGESATASAAGLDQFGVAIGIGVPTWSSTSPGVATVSASGVVSAVAPGRTMLVASVNGKQGERLLTIVQAVISRVSITPAALRMVRGATLLLRASALDFNGRELPGRRIDWTTSDATKATVSSAGVVTALSPGVVMITATGEGVSASTVVTVTGSADSVATVTLGPTTATLTVGGSVQLVATLKDGAGSILTGRAVSWSATGVAGANVATVSNTGLVMALSAGTVIVEAFSEGQHGEATITVRDNVDTNIVITFATPEEKELVGDTLRVLVTVKSAYPLVSVVAAVGSIRTTLAYTLVGPRGTGVAYTGWIDITDLPTGPYQVVATATDNRGARGVGSRQFQRDTRTGKGGSGDQPKMK